MERTLEFTLNGDHPFSGRLAQGKAYHPGRSALVALAHGAANTMDHPLLVYLAEGLARSGSACLRFNFPYSEAGRPKPDGQDRLEATWGQVLAGIRADDAITPGCLVAAGKSMGGRVASQMAAGGRLPVQGLIFYGYPLHFPGREDHLRDAHLDSIRVPMLFFAGTRDPFCRPHLMRPVIERLGRLATLVEIEDADHSFALPGDRPNRQMEVYGRLLAESLSWIDALTAKS